MQENKLSRKEKLALVRDKLHTDKDFAWAFLRRNPAYRKHARDNHKKPVAQSWNMTFYQSDPDDYKAKLWGLEFFRKPRPKSGFRLYILV